MLLAILGEACGVATRLWVEVGEIGARAGRRMWTVGDANTSATGRRRGVKAGLGSGCGAFLCVGRPGMG